MTSATRADEIHPEAAASSDPVGLLPPILRERSRRLNRRPLSAAGGFILYWMRTALRADENPALEAALVISRAAGVPVFVYQGLSERYPFASDRHHLFILQGARDVAAALERRGVGYAFHLERPQADGPYLETLAAAAAAVVTEDMPVQPLAGWTAALARRGGCPVVAVDTACVVPMRQTPWPFARAFEFRRATAEFRRRRLDAEWTAIAPAHPPILPELPFAPVDLEGADLAGLVADCRIDHGVAPVAHTRGGGAVGYERWRRFRDRGLRHYHRRRNDPLRDGVSRMSPYLHYGMVSPFRLAREAAAEGSPGAQKFLDELLVWRELAYAHCFHQPRHREPEALPAWARETLARHQADPRPRLPSWEQLARARTGSQLWDAAQESLLRHGELHNNVRMTWGKALLSWTRDAGEALRRLEDLNHRYALDGRDPASYGGILWCLGLFDRPFRPERPILGSVRSRSIAGHARRLDVRRYRARTAAPSIAEPPRVLVVGGGLAGLACARTLADAGLQVEVVDKGRGAGGRASTRRMDGLAFDHGAQYFTVRDHRFRTWVDSWRQDGIVKSWEGRIGTLEDGRVGSARGAAERFVGVPGMSALGRHLAADLELHAAARVEALERRDGRWVAREAGGSEHRADVAVLALPAPQALALIAAGTAVAEAVAAVEMTPCWAVMAAFAEPVACALDGAFVAGSPLAWVARNSSKPGRPAAESWVLHAGPQWSARHLETGGEEVRELLLAAFAAAIGESLPEVETVVTHRWLHAQASRPLGRESLYDHGSRLGVCGDWCPGARIEGAFLSGVAMAGDILRRAAVGEAGRGAAPGEQLSLSL